jgi:hypothetical protein
VSRGASSLLPVPRGFTHVAHRKGVYVSNVSLLSLDRLFI